MDALHGVDTDAERLGDGLVGVVRVGSGALGRSRRAQSEAQRGFSGARARDGDALRGSLVAGEQARLVLPEQLALPREIVRAAVLLVVPRAVPALLAKRSV